MPRVKTGMVEVVCPHMRPDQVQCFYKKCESCGWNPAVAEARNREIQKKLKAGKLPKYTGGGGNAKRVIQTGICAVPVLQVR